MALTRLSLRARLTLGTTVATLLAMAALVAGTQIIQRQAALTDARTVLDSRVAAAAATVVSSRGQARVLETPGDTLEHAVWIFDRRGVLLEGRNPGSAVAGTILALRGATTTTERTIGGRYLVRAVPLRAADGTVVATIIGAADLRPYQSGAMRSLWLSVIIAVAAVLAAAAASWGAATRALHRVRVMAEQADDWREHDLDRRFPDAGEDELGRLGSTLNRMLDRIAAAIRSERRLTDGVAHELRTPLSVVRAEAQLALSRAEPAEKPLEGIVRATERMDASISALLAAARAHHGGSEVCRVDDALAQTARWSRPPAGITVSVAPGEDRGEVAAPLELVVAMLKPLMENAVLHARHTVTLDAEVGADTVLLHVDDDGPGLSPELRDTAFDAGVSSREGGTGLGLPLAQRLARSAGGSVSAPDLPVSRFTVRLPRAWPSS